MENTIYYTFSTISQTLAGAIGLLAAFVLYRLQIMNAEIEKLASSLSTINSSIYNSKEIRAFYSTNNKLLYRYYSTKQYADFVKCFDNDSLNLVFGAKLDEINSSELGYSVVKFKIDIVSLTNLVPLTYPIKRKLINSLKVTVITIVYSVSMLMLSQIINFN